MSRFLTAVVLLSCQSVFAQVDVAVVTQATDLFTGEAVEATTKVLDTSHVDGGIISYHVLIQASGYLDRETVLYGDAGGLPFVVAEGLVTEDEKLVKLMDQTTRRNPNADGTIGTIRFDEVPTLYIALACHLIPCLKWTPTLSSRPLRQTCTPVAQMNCSPGRKT